MVSPINLSNSQLSDSESLGLSGAVIPEIVDRVSDENELLRATMVSAIGVAVPNSSPEVDKQLLAHLEPILKALRDPSYKVCIFLYALACAHLLRDGGKVMGCGFV